MTSVEWSAIRSQGYDVLTTSTEVEAFRQKMEILFAAMIERFAGRCRLDTCIPFSPKSDHGSLFDARNLIDQGGDQMKSKNRMPRHAETSGHPNLFGDRLYRRIRALSKFARRASMRLCRLPSVRIGGSIRIERLTLLCQQIRAAGSFEDLDIGWWEPLIEEIESGDQLEELKNVINEEGTDE